MLKALFLILTLALVGCFKKDEAVVEDFYKKVAVEKKFSDALNLLSKNARSKMDPDILDQVNFMNTLVSINKYQSLYDYQAKRFEIKIDGVEEMGKNAKVVTVSYKIVNFTNDAMKFYEKKSQELKTEDAEKIFNDDFIAEYSANIRREKDMFFINISEKVLIVKEENNWVIDAKNLDMFFRNLKVTKDLERHSYFDVTDLQMKNEK